MPLVERSLLSLALLAGLAACGSTETPSHESSWLIRLRADDKEICSGAMIGASWVITARHCVEHRSGSARPGRNKALTVTFYDGASEDVAEIHVPETRYQTIGQLHGSDIALIRIANPQPDVSYLQLACGPVTAPMRAAIVDPSGVRLVTAEVLKVERTAIYARDLVGPGYSGTPLISKRGLIGIASWRSVSVNSRPLSVFSRTAPYASWIDERMQTQLEK